MMRMKPAISQAREMSMTARWKGLVSPMLPQAHCARGIPDGAPLMAAPTISHHGRSERSAFDRNAFAGRSRKTHSILEDERREGYHCRPLPFETIRDRVMRA